MKRYYYLSKEVKDTVSIHEKLTEKGLNKDHIHVYGLADEVAQENGLNAVLSIFKSDVIHYILRGIILGTILSLVAWLGIAYVVDDFLSYISIAILFSVLFTGFISWEAGLIGLHKVNYKFVPLLKMLNKSNHIVIIDVSNNEVATLIDILEEFKTIKVVAVGTNIINPFEQQETLLPR